MTTVTAGPGVGVGGLVGVAIGVGVAAWLGAGVAVAAGPVIVFESPQPASTRTQTPETRTPTQRDMRIGRPPRVRVDAGGSLFDDDGALHHRPVHEAEVRIRPGLGNVRSNEVSCTIPESHSPSGMQPDGQVPDVVEWEPLTQYHWTVSPA